MAKQADGEPGTLAEQLAEAGREAAGPRSRVAALEAEMTAAVAAGQFGEAERLKGPLAAARQELAVIEGRASGLRQAAAAIERQAAAEARPIAEARRQALAEKIRAEAREAEQRAVDAEEVALAQVRASLAAAQDAFREAERYEARILDARQRERGARQMAGEWPQGHPGPVVIGPDRTRMLAGSDPLIRELTRWKR